MLVLLEVLLNCTAVVLRLTGDGICLEHGVCETPKVITEVLHNFFYFWNEMPAQY